MSPPGRGAMNILYNENLYPNRANSGLLSKQYYLKDTWISVKTVLQKFHVIMSLVIKGTAPWIIKIIVPLIPRNWRGPGRGEEINGGYTTYPAPLVLADIITIIPHLPFGLPPPLLLDLHWRWEKGGTKLERQRKGRKH